jgi:hypothetical protein
MSNIYIYIASIKLIHYFNIIHLIHILLFNTIRYNQDLIHISFKFISLKISHNYYYQIKFIINYQG